MPRCIAPGEPQHGVVAALGTEALQGAEAWSAALDRPLVSLDALDDLPTQARERSVTLAVPPGDLTTARLMRLAAFAVRHGLSVGVVRATPVAAARHAQLSLRPDPGRLAAYSHLTPERKHWVLDCSVSGRPDAERFVRGATTHQHAAVFVQTHGNGSDMAIGPLVVCARADGQLSEEAIGLPCFAGGPCLRGAGPEAEPDRFIAPERLQADSLVLDTCWGVVPDDGVWATSTTLAHAILAGPWTRNLLAPFSPHEASVGVFLKTVRAYQEAVSLGELALRLNRHDGASGWPPGWVLFGDPETQQLVPGHSG